MTTGWLTGLRGACRALEQRARAWPLGSCGGAVAEQAHGGCLPAQDKDTVFHMTT